MRASDQKLHDALKNVGLDDLAGRAATGEWNEYFGAYAFPQQQLTAEIQKEFFTVVAEAYKTGEKPDPKETKRANLINSITVRVMAGEFDATPEESKEWAASPEGQQTFGEFGLKADDEGNVVKPDELREQAEGDSEWGNTSIPDEEE